MANLFNKYFASIGERMSYRIGRVNLPKNYIKETPVQFTLFFGPVNKTEIYNNIMGNDSSPDPDLLNTKLTKSIGWHI